MHQAGNLIHIQALMLGQQQDDLLPSRISQCVEQALAGAKSLGHVSEGPRLWGRHVFFVDPSKRIDEPYHERRSVGPPEQGLRACSATPARHLGQSCNSLEQPAVNPRISPGGVCKQSAPPLARLKYLVIFDNSHASKSNRFGTCLYPN